MAWLYVAHCDIVLMTVDFYVVNCTLFTYLHALGLPTTVSEFPSHL